MEAPVLRLACQFVSESVAGQRIQGTVGLRIWGQSADPANLATWALSIRVVSRDGKEERGVLLPLTTGGESESFGSDLAPLILGPLTLAPVDALRGDRVVIELGSRGAARVESRDDGQAWVQFSADILFEDLNTHFKEGRTSRKVGKCIYCGLTGEPLSREHIIPEGLNGEFTLIAASCARCRNITSGFEQEVLRNTFGAARIALEMRSKRPNERPSHLPIQVRRGGKEIEIQVPVQEYPAILALPIFAQPAYLAGRPSSSGIDVVGTAQTQVAGLPLAELQRKYEGDYLGVRLAYQPVMFARAVAKIAYGFTVLSLGLEHIADRYVLPALLGEMSNIGRWVGCDRASPLGPSTGLHAVTLRMEDKEIHVMVRLFAQFGAPEYHVVIGRVL